MTVPVVGMGVTFMSWHDRNPGTIQEVFTQGKYLYIGCTPDEVSIYDNIVAFVQRPDRPRVYFRQPKANPEAQFQGTSKVHTGRWRRTLYIARLGVREHHKDQS